MTDKKNEYDPEKHKEVEDGVLKSEHINQYGEKEKRKKANRLEGSKKDDKKDKK